MGGNSQNGRWPSSFRAQSRPPEAGRRNQRVGRLVLPVFGLAASFPRSACQASYWGVPGRGGASGGNPPIQCGMSATWGPPAQPETNRVLELSGARVESFALQTAFVCVLIEHVSPHGGIDFLTHQLSTSVGGRCDLVQDHAESGLPTTTGCLSGLRRRTGSTGRWHHRGRACLTRPSSESFKKENNSVHMDSSKSGIR